MRIKKQCMLCIAIYRILPLRYSNFDGSNPNVWCSLGILFFRLSQVSCFHGTFFVYVKFSTWMHWMRIAVLST